MSNFSHLQHICVGCAKSPVCQGSMRWRVWTAQEAIENNKGRVHYRALARVTHISMETEVAYCVKCREKRDMKDPAEVEMKGGRRAMQGTCSVCSTKMFKILGKAK